MSFGFNSKFQDTGNNKNKIKDSVSNIFDLTAKPKMNVESNIMNSKNQPEEEKPMRDILQEIEYDANTFYNQEEKEKIKYYCKFA